MKKEKMKHMILIIVAVCLIGIGYLNYDYDSTIEVASVENQANNQVDESTLRRCTACQWKCSQRRNCTK